MYGMLAQKSPAEGLSATARKHEEEETGKASPVGDPEPSRREENRTGLGLRVQTPCVGFEPACFLCGSQRLCERLCLSVSHYSPLSLWLEWPWGNGREILGLGFTL